MIWGGRGGGWGRQWSLYGALPVHDHEWCADRWRHALQANMRPIVRSDVPSLVYGRRSFNPHEGKVL